MDWDHQLIFIRTLWFWYCCRLLLSLPLRPSPLPAALSATEQNQLDLSQALGIPLNNETPAVRDPSEHPKANASTFVPPQNSVQNNAGKSRTNAQNVKEIQQIGGAYGAYRN